MDGMSPFGVVYAVAGVLAVLVALFAQVYHIDPQERPGRVVVGVMAGGALDVVLGAVRVREAGAGYIVTGRQGLEVQAVALGVENGLGRVDVR